MYRSVRMYKYPILICALLSPLTATTYAADAEQPPVVSRVHPLLHVQGYTFRDANGNGRLDPYEDWRLSAEQRSADLVARMTLREKAGMMMIDTFRVAPQGAIRQEDAALIREQHMTRFIFRNPVVSQPQSGTNQLTPREVAEALNQAQEMAERTPHGIPALFKSNARNHLDPQAREGTNVISGAFSSWPKEAGLAATRDMSLIREFAGIMAQEWRAVGIRGMYGYMMDLATEPRWYRVHETFTEDADLMSDIARQLILGLQGERLGRDSIALTIKHFPGGGPQENGGDPHYAYGKNQNYAGQNFRYHLKPFITAIELGVSAIMPYYGIPVGQALTPNDVGMAFSAGVITGLLREQLGFKGYVNSDTGIIGDRAWGIEHLPEQEQIAIAVNAGTDVLSGYHSNAIVYDTIRAGKISQERVDLAVSRLLKEQFTLGLFENAYVDPERATQTLGNKAFQALASLAQRKSIVLLKNGDDRAPLLPLAPAQTLYVVGMDKAIVEAYGFRVISGDRRGGALPAIPPQTARAIVRVVVSNPYVEARRFGGAAEDELNDLAFSAMARAKTWQITPSLADIQTIMARVGAANTILSINYRQPFVLDRASGMDRAGAILATFGVSDHALMDVLSGRFNPQGRLPFALPNQAQAVVNQLSDMPGYRALDTWRPYGFGLRYQ
ncbi:glycoside hydrolase family 3 protein [Edwardsiella piscicida]|uniref:beta-glucosidase n=1 Tax=Edwardsiella piscicida TaxID=1263550 RepID=A0AAQ3H4T8_EDWPI|nr:glycoside hydrolase family 3 N-terminal domain-containing protein [Edwardsiella piscicida]WDU91115.1 glycoside hydrolase family 3 N-terminal domain-containing protein [Edwardsiella piscicida]